MPGRGRPAHTIEYNGVSQTISAWSQETGLKATTIAHRIARGLPLCVVLCPGRKPRDRGPALQERDLKMRVLSEQGETLKQIGSALGITREAVRQQLNRLGTQTKLAARRAAVAQLRKEQ